jgi:hypothetical protein
LTLAQSIDVRAAPVTPVTMDRPIFADRPLTICSGLPIGSWTGARAGQGDAPGDGHVTDDATAGKPRRPRGICRPIIAEQPDRDRTSPSMPECVEPARLRGLSELCQTHAAVIGPPGAA